MCFNEICEMAFRQDSLDRSAQLYDIQAYWCMWYLYRLQRLGDIDINRAKAEREKIERQHAEAMREREQMRDEWKRQQDGIRRTKGKISELVKEAKPDANGATLLSAALDVIGLLSGEAITSETIKKKLSNGGGEMI